MAIPGEEKGKGIEDLFDEIIAGNTPNIEWKMYTHRAKKFNGNTLYLSKKEKFSLKHVIVKL
jgi:hypothetical protein